MKDEEAIKSLEQVQCFVKQVLEYVYLILSLKPFQNWLGENS